jgi:predicted transcriptional regulator
MLVYNMLEATIDEAAPVTDTHKTFSIRIPVALYDSVDTAAADEHRSRNGIIISAITLYLERRRVAAEGSSAVVAEFDRAKTDEMTLDRTLQVAAGIQANPAAPVPAGLPATPRISDEAARAGQLTVRNPPKAVGGKS